jgi:hypothetical protein
LKATETTH